MTHSEPLEITREIPGELMPSVPPAEAMGQLARQILLGPLAARVQHGLPGNATKEASTLLRVLPSPIIELRHTWIRMPRRPLHILQTRPIIQCRRYKRRPPEALFFATHSLLPDS